MRHFRAAVSSGIHFCQTSRLDNSHWHATSLLGVDGGHCCRNCRALALRSFWTELMAVPGTLPTSVHSAPVSAPTDCASSKMASIKELEKDLRQFRWLCIFERTLQFVNAQSVDSFKHVKTMVRAVRVLGCIFQSL